MPYGDRDIRDYGVEYCISCNWQRFTDGGIMREMTKAEAVQWEKDEAAKHKALSERMARAALFHFNQDRQKTGLSPLSMKEWKEQKKRTFQQFQQNIRRPRAAK